MTDDPNGADVSDIILDLDDAGIEELADREIARADYVLNLIAARCGDEITDEDLALLAERDEPVEDTIPLEVGAQILEIVDQLMTRMDRLEASVPNSADIVNTVWQAMIDYPLEAKQAMLHKLELLVESEASTHHRLN